MSKPDSKRWKMLLLASVAVIAVFLGLTAGYRLLTERMADNQLFSVLINDQNLILDGRTLEQFNRDLVRLSGAQRQAFSDTMALWIDRWVDDAFGQAIDAVPGYMDWYYSLPGSYTRLYHALHGDLDKALTARMQGHLVDRSGFEDRLAGFEREFAEEFFRARSEQGARLSKQLAHRYMARQAGDAEVLPQPEISLDLDAAIQRGFVGGADDIRRWQVSSQASAVAGAGTLALLARRAIIPRLMSLTTVQAARRVAAGFAARLAPRMALAIGVGGSAAAATSPTGPGALVAGSVAFATAAGTIVITDFALLKAEEATLRDDKQQDIIDELVASRETTRALLKDQMQLAVAQTDTGWQQAFSRPYDTAGVADRFHVFGSRSAR
ncbi:MAG TPA: hypothetical protein ENI17_00810 [Pseudomonas xinjiangensis]|uniref:Uncharacterized protein n=2 Tax=root TaxID=1 RepID=A0A7V1BQ77_9GAMM|nr:hypothetical protein [Halopseudomonas xinjiangensis]HEC46160.1 hypothetical protein [Halopseudomonas xinjiangensis]